MHLKKYNDWLNSDIISDEIKNELKLIKDEKEIEDRFYKDLDFGTGGLRGIIGAGSNRMNIYTVGKATQGYAEHLNNNYEYPSVAIAYDSRNMSKEFAKTAALVFAANNIKVYLFEDLRPTPMLSFAVRELGCNGGVVITASHNPKEYNGYKVYGEDGCQVTDSKAKEIISTINNVDIFKGIKFIDEEEAVTLGLLQYIGIDIDDMYVERVKELTIRKELVDKRAKDLKIIYTPIHGSGLMPIKRTLEEIGYTNLHIVEEQKEPNGDFPTAPYPNPEDPKVFEIAIEDAKKIDANLIFGTDPDCDRIGVVVKDDNNEYKVLTGNQTGMLLTHYIINSLKELNKLPENPVVIKTIVTTDAIKDILKNLNVEVLDVLTGFKYIGEKIAEFEETNKKNFIFGMEESYGYLAGTFVRDKDGVIAATLIAEMALYYNEKGMNLYDALMEIYKTYGYSKEKLIAIELKGKEGQEKIISILERLRKEPIEKIYGLKVKKVLDYKLSEEYELGKDIAKIKLPKSNVIKYVLEDDSWFVIRPSGTEPKMKVYISVKDKEDLLSKTKLEGLKRAILDKLNL